MSDSAKKQLIFGKRPVIEALQTEELIDKVFVYKNISTDVFNELRTLCKGKSTQLQAVPREKLNRLTRKNHQGIVAFRALIEYQSIDNVVPFVFEKGEIPLIVALDGITDVRNFGAIARTCFGMNVHAILIPEKGSAMINAEALKSSAGTLNQLPVCKTNNLASSLKGLKNHGLKVIGTTGTTDNYISDIDMNDPLVLVLGSEGYGISKQIRVVLDEECKIPISNALNSYNVSVSAGIALYEIVGQRRKS